MASWLMRMVRSSGKSTFSRLTISAPDVPSRGSASALPENGPTAFPYHNGPFEGDAVRRGNDGQSHIAPSDLRLHTGDGSDPHVQGCDRIGGKTGVRLPDDRDQLRAVFAAPGGSIWSNALGWPRSASIA